MYTRILVNYTIDIMLELLKYANVHQNIIDEFELLLKLCLKNNICYDHGQNLQVSGRLPHGSAPFRVRVRRLNKS